MWGGREFVPLIVSSTYEVKETSSLYHEGWQKKGFVLHGEAKKKKMKKEKKKKEMRWRETKENQESDELEGEEEEKKEKEEEEEKEKSLLKEQILKNAIDYMYDHIGMRFYDSIPKKEGGVSKRVVFHPNLVLFELYGIKTLDNSCSEKIQPRALFRPSSPLHIWKYNTMKKFKSLFKRVWGVNKAPSKKVVKYTSERKPELVSFVSITKDHPVTISFSVNTGLLTIIYSWRVINIVKNVTLDIF